MKTRQLILTVMITVICCSAVAQSHIDKVVDEIEQKGVDVSKVVKRDPKTKKAYSIVKSLTFYSKDGNYANRLKEAFQKDAEDATEEKVEKKGNHYLLVFINGKKKTTYTLNIQEQQEKNPRVDLKIIMRDGNVKEIDKYDDLMNVIGTKGIQFRGLEGLEGLDYFESRNLDAACRTKYKLGYSFKDGKATCDFLQSKGHSLKTIDDIGIAVFFHERHQARTRQCGVVHRSAFGADMREVMPHSTPAFHELHLLLVDAHDGTIGVGIPIQADDEAVGQRRHLVVISDARHGTPCRNDIPEMVEEFKYFQC